MRQRKKTGAMLIELLVALVVAGILMVTLTASICELMRLSTKSQNDSVGAQIAANVMERVRSTPYAQLTTGLSSPVVVHLGDGVPVVASVNGSVLLNRPAMIDAVQKFWSTTSGGLPASTTPATARISLNAIAGEPDSRLVKVVVRWNSYDEADPKAREFVLQSFVNRYGIQKNE